MLTHKENLQLVWKLHALLIKSASWSSGNAFVFEAGGQRFKFRAGQIRHNVAIGSSPLPHFFERSCVAREQRRGDGPRRLVARFGVLQRV